MRGVSGRWGRAVSRELRAECWQPLSRAAALGGPCTVEPDGRGAGKRVGASGGGTWSCGVDGWVVLMAVVEARFWVDLTMEEELGLADVGGYL